MRASLPVGKWKAGSPHQFVLVVHNAGKRACTVDIGAAKREFQVRQGARTLWSSNHCDQAVGSDVEALAPNQKRGLTLIWSGTTSQPGCAGQRAKLGKGTYELVVRLDNRTSPARQFTLI